MKWVLRQLLICFIFSTIIYGSIRCSGSKCTDGYDDKGTRADKGLYNPGGKQAK